MNNIERQRAGAEARRDLAAQPGRDWHHEDQLLRHLGAVYYDVQRGRAKPEELKRAVAEVDTHVSERDTASEPGKPRRPRRRWWRLRSGS